MPRGRPRKSPREKALEGSRSPTKVVEIFAPRGLPFVPDHLNDDAQQCIRHIIANFSSKHISSVDSYALSVFAVAWAWHKHAVQVMSEPGFEPVIGRTDKNGQSRVIPSPWFKILNEQARLMNSIAPKTIFNPRRPAEIARRW
jgi:phage terminase small subunit